MEREIKKYVSDHPFETEFVENYVADFDSEFDDFEGDDEGFRFSDIDFSDLSGNDFKKNLKKLDHRINIHQKNLKRNASKGNRLSKKIRKANKRPTSKIIVPDDRNVIIQSVNKFILSSRPEDNAAKSLGYYKGKKLNMLTLTFNNNSLNDFSLNLFDPSMPLDYLFSNGISVNDKIQVAGGEVSYSNLLFNLLANPTMIISAQVFCSATIGGNDILQLSEAMIFRNQNIAGLQAVEPVNVNLSRDIMQKDSNLVTFEFNKKMNRPFVPDGMDVIQYKILAGNTVTINFYYKQVQIKRMVFEECRKAKNLL